MDILNDLEADGTDNMPRMFLEIRFKPCENYNNITSGVWKTESRTHFELLMEIKPLKH